MYYIDGQQTINDGYIFIGQAFNGGININKVDQTGEPEWSKSYTGSAGQSISQTSDGGYVFAA